MFCRINVSYLREKKIERKTDYQIMYKKLVQMLIYKYHYECNANVMLMLIWIRDRLLTNVYGFYSKPQFFSLPFK